MKITGPESLQQPQPGSPQSPKGPGKTGHFDDMLQDALNQPNTAGGVGKSAPLSEPRAVHALGRQTFQAGGIVDRTSRAIDLLDSYSKALSDPGKSLRDIEPQLTAFVSEARSLYEDYKETATDDPQLKSMMEELLRTAHLEEIRFQRGDYLDTE